MKRTRKKGVTKVRNATKVKHEGIEFKSKLEFSCYEALKNAQIDFAYEQKSYVLNEGFEHTFECFEPKSIKGSRKTQLGLSSNKVRPITYTPDFVGKNWVIETKGRPNDSFPLRWKMFKRHIQSQHPEIKIIFIASSREQIYEAIHILKSRYV